MERGSAGELLIPKQCLENALARHKAHRSAHAQKVVQIAVHGPGDPELNPTERVIHHGADGTTVVLRDERVRQRLEHHDEAAIVRQVTPILHPMLRSL
jgi:hypothetical protein